MEDLKCKLNGCPNIDQEDKSFEAEFNFHLILYATN
jgi:hypothetical protein